MVSAAEDNTIEALVEKTLQRMENPRYLAYARAHGASSGDEMIERDRITWPGGIMCGFILWNTARLREFSKINPSAFFMGRGLIDPRAYDAWLNETYPFPPATT